MAGVVSALFLVVPVVVLVGTCVLIYLSLEIVPPDRNVVVLGDGEIKRVLDPGVDFVLPILRETRPVIVGPQEQTVTIETTLADESSVRVEAVVQFEVDELEVAHEWADKATGDHADTVAGATRSVLTDVLGGVEGTTHGARREIVDEVETQLGETLEQWGLRVESVEFEDLSRNE